MHFLFTLADVGIDLGLAPQVERDRAVDLFQCRRIRFYRLCLPRRRKYGDDSAEFPVTHPLPPFHFNYLTPRLLTLRAAKAAAASAGSAEPPSDRSHFPSRRRPRPSLSPGIPKAHRPLGLAWCELLPRLRRAHLPRRRSLRPQRLAPPRPVLRRSPRPPPRRPTIPECPQTGRRNPYPRPSL